MWNWLKKSYRNLDNPNHSLSDPTTWEDVICRTSSGENVNRKSVLGLPAYWRAIDLVSGKVAKCPLRVFASNSKGGSVPAKDHAAYRLLMRRPNDLMSPMVFKKTLQSHCMTHGNGFAYIFRSSDGTPIDLLILDPSQTHAVLENGMLLYVTTINGVDNKLLPENVLHWKGMSFDGLTGYSIIEVLRETLGLGLALQKYGSVFFSNNAMPKVIITLPANLKDPEKIQRFRTTWNGIHQNLNNSHKLALLENGSSITTIGGDNEKTQFLDSMNFNAISIANICGIPPSKLGVKDSGTSYNSVNAEDDMFLSDSLDAILVMIEEECERKLLTDVEFNSESHFVLFDRNALRQTDKNIETDILVKQYNNGLISFQEMRERQNLNVDGQGVYRLPNGCTIQSDPTKPPEATATPPTATATEPTQSPDDAAKRLQKLTETTLTRLMNRLSKAIEGGKVELEAHRGVFDESLGAFEHRSDFINNFFDELQQELEALPKADWSKVMVRRQDTIPQMARLLNV